MDNVIYSDSSSTGHGIDFFQDIIRDGEVIGCLETRFYGILEPYVEVYSMGTNQPENKLQEQGYSYSESEDEGWSILYFDSIEELLAAKEFFS